MHAELSWSSKHLHRVASWRVQVDWCEVAFSRCKLLGSARVFLHHALEDVLLARVAAASRLETIAVASIHSLWQKTGQTRKGYFHNWWTTTRKKCLPRSPSFYRSFGLSIRWTKTFDAFLYGFPLPSVGLSLDFRYASIFAVSICLILAARTL